MSLATNNAAGAGAVSRRIRPRRQHKCQHCARTFKRSEHCIRHERTHTREKPFVCRYCQKSYSRKDQVTRHERTLHAYAQEQRQDERHNSDLEDVEDQVNMALVPPARPSALETPPRDFEEPEADRDFARQDNGPAVRYRDLPSPGGRAGFSPSSSTFSSSNVATIVGGRRPSVIIASSAVAHSGDTIATTTTAAAAHTPACQRNTSPAAVNTSTNTQSRFATANADYNAGCASLDFATTYRTTTREHGTEAIDPDILPTAMTLDDEIQTAQAKNGPVSPHGRQNQNQHHPGTSAPPAQDAVPFFSPMPDVDLDINAFPFSPLLGYMMDPGSNQHNPPMTNDFSLPPPHIGDFEAMYNSPLQAQALPELDTTKSRTAHPDTPKPRGTSCPIPLLVQDERRPRPVLTLDETAYLSIRTDLVQRLGLPSHEINLPQAKVCQAFLSSYVTNFHGHLPIIHLRTLCPKETPSPLLLAMCSIGALYRLDRRRSRQLYDMASRSVEAIACPSKDDDKALVKNYSLWYVQARMLLSFYSIMSGEKDLVLRTMHENGFYTLVYNEARIALGTHKIALSRMTWHDWVENESWKRLLGGLLVESTLTMVLFDVNPGFNASQDLEFDIFHDEALWDAESSNEWLELRTNSLNQNQGLGRRTLKSVFIDIMQLGEYNPATAQYRVSAFSALVLMHAVVVHMWQRLQVSQAFAEPGCDSSFSATSYDQLGRSLLENSMKSLAGCDAFFRGAQSDSSGSDPDDAPETSLVFNCQAVLRIAYIRLFKPASPSNRISLISADPAETEASITSFVTTRMERNAQLLDAVTKSLEGLRIPVKFGHMLVRKTAAFRWSVEHAVAGWESALLVTKWVHSVEIAIIHGVDASPKERELLILIEEILQEAECDLSENVSLAAGVATTWGWLLQDVWIWGITPRMGSALELLAKGYERVKKANHRNSLNEGQ